jgi:hypothetical protein
MAAHERRWPIGTRQRVWLDVLAYTGLRRGDAVHIGRRHIRNGVAAIKTEKSGFRTLVTLPILPVLRRTLNAGPCGDLTFIVGANGKPMTKESFGNAFREACNAAGVSGSAHGVRKIAATRAAENGATVAELEAIFGWHGGQMASHYTREANRVRLSKDAMQKLTNETGSPIPSPAAPVRESGRNQNKINAEKFRWWAREDSNLQPSGYERPSLSGKTNNNRHLCARSRAFVHVWLRPIIG